MFWRVLLTAFSTAYLLALLAWGAGIWGWLGTPPDPLSAVWLVLLGQPWVRWIDSLPESLWPFAAAISPLFNLAGLWFLFRLTRPRS